MQKVVDEAVQLADSTVEGVRRLVGDSGIGMGEPDDQELAAFFFQKLHEEPPEPFVLPDGRVVTISPWILALGFADGGDEWLKRFNRVMARQGGLHE